MEQSPLAILAPLKQRRRVWSPTGQQKLGQFLFLLFTNEFNCTLNWSFWLVLLKRELRQLHTKPGYSVHLRMSHSLINDHTYPGTEWPQQDRENGQPACSVSQSHFDHLLQKKQTDQQTEGWMNRKKKWYNDNKNNKISVILVSCYQVPGLPHGRAHVLFLFFFFPFCVG